MKIGSLLICLFMPLTLMVLSAAAQPALKFSNVKAKGATETDTYAVNNAGVIAGDYIDKTGAQHGLILNGKTVTSFDGPSGSSSIAAYGINNSNAVVGWYLDTNGLPASFMYANGTMTPIAYPKGTSTEANGINDNGWIVGTYLDKSGLQHGFYWDTAKYHAITVKGATTTTAWAINNSNVITVYTTDSSGYPVDGYLLTGKKLTVVDVPGYTQNALHGIDNNGDLCYTVFDSSENRHGVLYQASTGTFTQFDDPKGVDGTRADGMNDSQEMVGRYTPSGGSTNVGFKATVKP
jgi:probable HAF family extracellular repeat protein